MPRLVGVALVVAALAFGGGSPARAAGDDDAAANRLLVEAVGLVERAEATVTPGDRAALYGRAIDNLDEIAARHPESDLAVRLAAGQPVGEIDRRALERQRRLSVAAGCIAASDRSCLLALALEMSPEIEDVEKRSWALSIIAAGQADAGAFEQALETANAATEIRHRAWALGAIAAAMAKAKGGAQVGKVIGDAVAAASAIDHAYERALALGEVGVWQAEAGDTSGARQTIRRAMSVANDLTDPSDLAMVFAQIAKAKIKVGDTAEGRRRLAHAVKLALQESFSIFRVEILSRIALVQADTGDTAGARETIGYAIEVLGSIRSRIDSYLVGWSRDRSLTEIANAQARTGDLDRAHETALRIGSPYWRTITFAQNAEVQFEVGDIAVAQKSIELAFEALKKLEDDSEIAASLAILGWALQSNS